MPIDHCPECKRQVEKEDIRCPTCRATIRIIELHTANREEVLPGAEQSGQIRLFQ